MAEVLEKTGKTVKMLYQAALAELGLPESRVSYEVIGRTVQGFFGHHRRQAGQGAGHRASLPRWKRRRISSRRSLLPCIWM